MAPARGAAPADEIDVMIEQFDFLAAHVLEAQAAGELWLHQRRCTICRRFSALRPALLSPFEERQGCSETNQPP